MSASQPNLPCTGVHDCESGLMVTGMLQLGCPELLLAVQNNVHMVLSLSLMTVACYKQLLASTCFVSPLACKAVSEKWGLQSAAAIGADCDVLLQVASPLTTLQALPAIRLVDLRGVHEEPDVGYWTEAKCISMKHIASFTKKMKQRPYGCKIIMDRD